MKKKRELSTTQVIALGFLLAILAGAFLLTLPVSSAAGVWTGPVDALFTASTSVCVTGLVVVDTYSYWSLFGQIVILFLIQIGGLGIVTLTTSVMVFMGRKVTLKDRLLLEDAFNLNTMSGLVRFLKKIIKGTLLIEGIGAVCYSFTFIPRFGFVKGLWVSVFQTVSAFCNAGMDIIGSNSYMDYVRNPWVNFVTMFLIILGGIGFIVWWDVVRVIQQCYRKEINVRQFFGRLKLHTKIVLLMTGILIFTGMIAVLALEYHNPHTLGELNFFEKLQASLFQSVTLRTAGFATISQKGLKESTSLVCMFLMFIGGSPVGTAGGIKTTTAAILFIAAFSVAKGKEEAVIFRRSIARETVRKALAIVVFSVMAAVLAVLLLLTLEQGSFMDVVYETFSAIGTVGLSRNFTPSLDVAGRLVISLCMYLGRIGPISMMIAFHFKKGKSGMGVYPKEDITVG